MDLSETLLDSGNISHLSPEYSFFPLTGLQVGRWLSAFHFEDQLFLFHPSPEKLVFLAVNSEGWQNANSQYFLSYTRKKLLKMFKNSPFTTPVDIKFGTEANGSFLDRLGAQYGGIAAFEIDIHEVEGVDYSNTIHSYGSRLTLEVNQAKKKWFSSLLKFCEHYNIQQSILKSKYYSPYLSSDTKSFATKSLHPENFKFKPKPKKDFNMEEIFITLTPNNIKKKRTKARRSLSVIEIPELSKENSYEKSYHECKFNDFTIVAYFEDPVFPFFIKNLLKNPKNKFLLTKYERGIPSWAQFLPSYGLPYRPWMRKVMAVIIFCFSFITMMLGFYDVYKNIPQLREVFSCVLGKFFQTFEDAVLIRLSVLLGYIIGTSQLFKSLILGIITFIPFMSDLLIGIGEQFKYLLSLVFSIKSLIKWVYGVFCLFGCNAWTTLSLMYHSLYLDEFFSLIYYGLLSHLLIVLSTVLYMLKELNNFICLLFSVPFEVVYGLTYGLFNVVFELFIDLYSFFYTIVRASRYVMALFKSNQNAVAESIGVFELVKNFWYDVFRHVLKGITSIYHFTVYAICNVYKHKDSIIVSFWIHYRLFLVKCRKVAAKYKYLLFQVMINFMRLLIVEI